jgi:type VI secretion system secreted protein VgrG
MSSADSPSFTQADRIIKVKTGLDDDVVLLERFSGTERISGLFRFTLDLLAADNTKVVFENVLGKSATVTLFLADGTKRYFNGIISRFSQANPVTSAHGVQTFYRYQAELVPKVWLLSRKVRSRVFQHQSVPQILTTVLSGYDNTPTFSGTYQPRDYCVQYNESDLDFALRLMEDEGMFFYFTHTDSSHTMQLYDASTSLGTITGSDPSVRYRQEYRDLSEDEVVFHWEKSQEVRSGKYTLRDRNFELTSNLEASGTMAQTLAVGAVTHQLQIEGNSDLEIYQFPGGYATRFDNKDRTGGGASADGVFNDSTRVAGLRMQEETIPAVLATGMSSSRRFAAAATFSLTDHFDGNGSYLLTRVDHVASVSESYLGGTTAGFEYANSFECVPATLAYRPPRVTPRPRIDGPQTAVVVGQQGDEIFTDAYSRVKVQFYWDRDSQSDPDSSCWVRVGSIWAGQNWGAIHIPRVGQEVIVAFLDGNPDRPIIVGSVYNDQNQPPYTLPDNKTQSGIKSRSSLNGTADNYNELRFEDLKGSELITFHAEKDFERVVENNDTLTVGVDGSESLKDGSQTNTIYKNRTTTIKTGDETFTVEQGKRTETIEGDDSLTVKTGNRSVTVNTGNDTHEVKTGNRTVTIDTGDQTHTIKMGNRSVTLNMGNDSLTLDMGNQSITLSLGNHSLTCDLGSSTTEALQGVTLKSGPASIQVTPMGVTIKGMLISIEAEMMCTVKGVMTQVNGDAILMAKGGITMIG